MRTRPPAPAWPPPVTCTPGVRAAITSCTLLIGARSTSDAASMFATALPSSTRRCSPVAVVTTSVSFTTTGGIAKSTVAASPAATVTGFFSS